jgi:acyl-CoA thioesterase
MGISGPDAHAIAQRSAEAMYAADGASQRLGIAITDVAPGRATAAMRITSDMVNGHGIAHGGYVFLLADTAFAFACNTYGERVVARGASIVFVAAVHAGDELVATGMERVRYGRNGVYDITVRRAGTDDVVAEFRGESHTTRRSGE